VTRVVGEGRSYVAHSDEPYDIVSLTMVDAWIGAGAGAFMFVENNLYTVEGVRAYLSHLSPGGVVTITRYYPHHETLRLASVVRRALLEEGVARPEEQMIVVRGEHRITGTVLAFRGPVTPETVRSATAALARIGGQRSESDPLPARQRYRTPTWI